VVISSERSDSSSWRRVGVDPTLLPEVDAEYARQAANFQNQHSSRPGALSVLTVLRAHYCVSDYFIRLGEGIGGVGPKHPDLLNMAVDRQHFGYCGKDKWTTKLEIAATLFFGLVKLHPFVDGNKRTALLTLLFHLQELGYAPSVHANQLEQLTTKTAEGSLGDYKERGKFKESIRNTKDDCDVQFLAYFLKHGSRQVDDQYRPITYDKLDTLLRRKGYSIEDKDRNYANIVKHETEVYHKWLMKRERSVRRVICRIGYPGGKTIVGIKEMKFIRESLGFTKEAGYDWASFYQGVQPMRELIAAYEEPLRRLAYT